MVSEGKIWQLMFLMFLIIGVSYVFATQHYLEPVYAGLVYTVAMIILMAGLLEVIFRG